MAIAHHSEPDQKWSQAAPQQQPARLPAAGAGAAGNTLFVTQLAVGSLTGVLERAVQVQTAVLNAIPALVALIDRSGTVLAVNGAWQAFAREIGRGGELHGVGKSYFSIMPPTYASTAARATDGIREVLSGAAREFTTRYPCQTAHGKRWFKLLVAPLSSAGVEGAVAMHIDITDQVRAELAARAAKLRAQTASQRKSEFLAKVSHELRTPLNAIMGYSEMLGLGMLGELAPKQAEYVRDIHRSGQHLLGLLEDLIDLSKAEAGVLEIDEQEVRLDDVIAHCIRMVVPRARARDVLIEIEGGLGCAVVRGDGKRLKQILLNLLTNAVKFTPARGQI
ncbi:MAG: histidine kinase dimerization/phospho-acceptor domain-containing protein, partial [Geminicoccales bacterium]